MIDHVWTVLCSRSVIDVDSNSVSIQDVIEQITVNAEPVSGGFLPIPLEIITLWARKEDEEPAKGIERLTFVQPSKKESVISEGEVDLSRAERHRHRIRLPGLPLSETGRHLFRVEIKEDDDQWHKVAAIPLSVRFQPPDGRK